MSNAEWESMVIKKTIWGICQQTRKRSYRNDSLGKSSGMKSHTVASDDSPSTGNRLRCRIDVIESNHVRLTRFQNLFTTPLS